MSVKRSYSSARRDAQARETRRSVLEAALRLFVAHGYAATTIQAIADESGVAVQTVYAAFGTKRELMRQLIEGTIAGDESAAGIEGGAAAAVEAVAAEPDARRRAQFDAAIARTIVQRVAPLVRVAEEAAASDPDLAATMETVRAARRREMLDSATLLAGPDGLHLGHEEAAATLYVLYSPQVADMLIRDHGWSPARYEAWLARMIQEAVLGVTPDDRA